MQNCFSLSRNQTFLNLVLVSAMTLVLILLLCMTATASSFDPGTNIIEAWNKTFGGDDKDYGYSVQQTTDGGCIIAGFTNSYGAGDGDVWLIKTSQDGVEQWNRTFGGTGDDCGYSVQQTSDGGYIIAGETQSYGTGIADVWLIKTGLDGVEQWNRTFGGEGLDWGHSVQQTSDGGYVIAGRIEYYARGPADAWLIKTDSNGVEEWNRTFGTSACEYAASVNQTTDGGYIIAGRTTSYGAIGGPDAWLIRTDANGIEEWNRTFGGAGYNYGYSVQQTTDGGYIIAGSKNRRDAWLIKTDADGIEEWNSIFGGAAMDEGYSVQQTTDGGYIVAGYTESYGTGSGDVWVIKTAPDGNEQWNKTFGGADLDEGYSVRQTADGGYIVAGFTTSYGAGYAADVWLIKIKSPVSEIFDTGPGTYPSIYGVHKGIITPVHDVTVRQMYTYPCAGTGGHTEYVELSNKTFYINATWNGYHSDYHNITFPHQFTLLANHTYSYTIKTGSYPQIHHRGELAVDAGLIRCTKFTDANGEIYYDWIPAIKLYQEKINYRHRLTQINTDKKSNAVSPVQQKKEKIRVNPCLK